MCNPRLLGAAFLAALALFTPHTTGTRVQAAGPHLDLSHVHYVTPHTFMLRGIPPAGRLVGPGDTNFNWTGYGVLSNDNHNDYFTQVEGAWTVPPAAASSSGTKAAYVWVGLGGDEGANPESTVLWQAGTLHLPDSCLLYTYHGTYNYDTQEWAYTTTCGTYASWDQGPLVPRVSLHGQYAFWYDDYGCTPGGLAPCPNPHGTDPIFLSQPAIHAGDRVYVTVNGATGRVFFANLTTGEAATVTVSIENTNTGLSAEWIAEESGAGAECGPPSFECASTDFGDPAFSSAYAYGSTMSTYVDIFNYRRYDLINWSDDLLAQPPPLNRRTHGFSVTCCAQQQ